jgi:hypothetical protein
MKLWLDPSTGQARVDRRVERINDDRIDRVYRAYRLLAAYTNPLRGDMPLSKTELAAVERATKILRGTVE